MVSKSTKINIFPPCTYHSVYIYIYLYNMYIFIGYVYILHANVTSQKYRLVFWMQEIDCCISSFGNGREGFGTRFFVFFLQVPIRLICQKVGPW